MLKQAISSGVESTIFANQDMAGTNQSNSKQRVMDCTTKYQTIESRLSNNNRFRFSVVKLIEDNHGVSVLPLYLDGVKVLENLGGGVTVGTTIEKLQRNRGASGGGSLIMGYIDAETKGTFTIAPSTKGKIEVSISIENFTNGANPFQEVLVCK
ncbi:MAG TPA: hypothetical protein VIG33_07485 [Pseudobdellovibrionaceae bacterium]|jgi:hypothetical protein